MNFAPTQFALLFLLSCAAAQAGSGTWLTNPIDNNWSNPANWSSGTVPSTLDIATFEFSAIDAISVASSGGVGGILFNPGASSYTFTNESSNGFTFRGSIVNNSGIPQNFVLASDGSGTVPYFSLFGIFGAETAIVGSMVTFTVHAPGVIDFGSYYSAGEGTIIAEAATIAGQQPGVISFAYNHTTAGDSTIINRGATVSGAEGGHTYFAQQTPTAGNATIIAEGGSNGGGGGAVIIYDLTTGETARIEVFGNGYADISQLDIGSFSIGSLEGSGLMFLGRKDLSIGGNNLSTEFSGIMQDGGIVNEAGASIKKVGAGTLTLTGANTYTGGTTVDGGQLVVENSSGSATGTAVVLVKSGMLGGDGIIFGPVTVGTGSGSGAFLAPAHGTSRQATLTIQGALTLNSDATFSYTLKAKRNRLNGDKVISNGVAISRGATFDLSGSIRGKLVPGTVLSVISNTSAAAIAGAFNNLPDGGLVHVNGNNLQANYEGGDGNDLTLTVVP